MDGSTATMSAFNMLQVCSLLVLVLVLSPVAESNCSYLTRAAKCKGMNLNVIPDEIPFDVTALDLSYSFLATLNWTSLAVYNNIEKLKMMACSIDQLPNDFFSELQELAHLDLSYNRLTHVHKDTFKFNIRLRELALNGNKLHFDSAAPFLVSYSIIRLQLRYCEIQKISNITFRDMKTLKHLDLYGNKIISINYITDNSTEIEMFHPEAILINVPYRVKSVATWMPVLVVVKLAILYFVYHKTRLYWYGKRGEKHHYSGLVSHSDMSKGYTCVLNSENRNVNLCKVKQS